MLRQYVWPRLKGVGTLRLIYLLLGFLISLLLANLLGATEFGRYTYVFSLIALLALPASLGFEPLLTREIAHYREAGQWGLARQLITFATQRVLMVSVVLMVVGVAVSLWWPGAVEEGLKWPMVLALLSLPFYALVPIRQGVLTGLHQTVLAQWPENIIRPGLLIIAIGMLFLWSPATLSAEAMVAANGVAMALAFLAGGWLLWRHLPGASPTRVAPFQQKIWLRQGIAFMALSGMHVVNSHADILMIGSMAGAEAAGLYQVPTRLAIFVQLPFFLMEMVLAPLIARSKARREMDNLVTLANRLTRLTLLATLPLAVVFAVFRFPILDWFGTAFSAGHQVLLVLLAGVLMHVVIGPVGYLTTMLGHERKATQIMSVTSVVNLVLNLWMIPRYGIVGAAIATVVSEACWKLALWWFLRRQLQLRIGILSR